LARALTRSTALVATAVLSITTIAFIPGTGSAEPSLSIQQVQQRVDALYNEAEAAAERAHTIAVQVTDARHTLQVVRADIKQQRRQYEKLRAVIADVAANMYASGGIDPSVQMMLSSSPGQFLQQAQSLDQVMRSQDADLRRAETAQLELQQSQEKADQELARLRSLRADAQKEKQAADEKLAEAQQLLSRLKAQQRQRLARLEAQRQAAAEAAARSQQRTTPTPSTSAPTTPAPTTSSSSSGRGATAAAFARAQLGKPYVFGAAGPSAFDCSGLTMAAWAQVGVALPHSASLQYADTARVDSGSLMPGDLVFFYSDIHHVGMYVGGGMFVHAANPTDGVVEEPLFTDYWQSVYMGAGRP